MKFIILISFLLLDVGFSQPPDYKQIHDDALVIDTHNDAVQRILAGDDLSMHTVHGQSDLPRFREGGIDGEVFSIWVSPEKPSSTYARYADEQIEAIQQFVMRNPQQATVVYSSNEIRNAVSGGKFAVMLGIEGGHVLGNDLNRINHFYNRGVRYLSLTWNNSTSWATSARDESGKGKKLRRKGLSDFGKEVIRRMNDLGMIVDVSHAGEQTFWDAVATSSKPIIASHSCAWALCRHYRNLKDDQLKAIAKKGGVVFVTFEPHFIDSGFTAKERTMRERYKTRIDSFRTKLGSQSRLIKDMRVAEFLQPEYEKILPSLSRIVDHIDYIVKLIGVGHVGIGSDFDGMSIGPNGMHDVTDFPNLTRELLTRGYAISDIRQILGENFLRVLKENEQH